MWAMLSPLFLGTVPMLAKLTFAAGADVRTIVAFRTIFAVAALWLGALPFARHLISSSYPATSSSLTAGGINGVRSLFFYGSLARIDASPGRLTNIT